MTSAMRRQRCVIARNERATDSAYQHICLSSRAELQGPARLDACRTAICTLYAFLDFSTITAHTRHPMEPDDAIVVTGMGVVSPVGCTLDDFWSGLCAGASAARVLDEPQYAGLSVPMGCPVQGFEDCTVVTRKEARRLDPFAQYALTAAMTAYEDAGSPVPDAAGAAVVVGNGIGGQRTAETQGRQYLEGGPGRVSPLVVPTTMPNAAAGLVAIRLGWRGPSLSISTACASGAHAIGEAYEMIRSGRARAALAGGTEATMTPYALTAFTNLQATSRRLEDPGRASRPFDVERDGFVMGEGAAFVMLERLGDARARGARPYARLSGYAASTDAHHLVMPVADGAGAVSCMEGAIAAAGLRPADITHINAHGTSTRLNDRVEAIAVRKVFGDAAPPVTSTKGVTGHLIAGAGAVELVASVLAMHHREAPPTANYERSEPQIDIDVVHGEPRALPAGAVMSNSFGFGGHNASLIVEPV
jgi:3-oxoacyl-[acyl-carrier-protein] synthase II